MNSTKKSAVKRTAQTGQKRHLKRPPQGERLGKPCVMLYTPDGKVGAFQANEYTRLLRTAAVAMGRAGHKA